MKKQLTFIFLVSIFLFGVNLNSDAQREVVIEGYPIAGGVEIADFVDAIDNALDDDATLRETEPDVTYILKRDHLYPFTKTIKNTFSLKMVAEEGEGAKPVILTWKDVDGKYDQLLEAKDDVYFENVQFDNRTPIGTEKGRSQRLIANGVRGEFVGVVIDSDDGAAFSIYADSCVIIITDCFVRNCGTETSYDSNGRFLDIRADTYIDSVVITNSTGSHLNGGFVRAGNAVIGYLEVNHCTIFHGTSANISSGWPYETVITNNLFKDAQMSGDVPSTNDPAETNPDLFHAACITFDTIWPDAMVTIRNNNIFYTDEVTAMWASHDTIYEPLKVNPMAMRALGDDSINAAFSEVITLTTACDPPLAYIEGFIIDQSLTEYPNQHCVGGDGGGYYFDEIDASYGTTAVSYTAADNGYPLGDLNWYPELKTRWDNGDALDVKHNMFYDQVKVYPNPASDILYISTEGLGEMTISFYDILGKELRSTIFNREIQIDINNFSKGLCLYRITDAGNNMIQSGKLLISK